MMSSHKLFLNHSIISDHESLTFFEVGSNSQGSIVTQYDPIPGIDHPESLTLTHSEHQFLKYVRETQEVGYRKSVDSGIGKLGIKGVAHLTFWQTKFPVGGDPRSILKKFVGHKELPAMMLYPIINKVSGREKVDLQITLIVEFLNPLLSGQAQIKEIRKINEVIISDYWKKCLEEPRLISNEFEETPHRIICGEKINHCPDFRKLSAEYGLMQQAFKVLENNKIIDEKSSEAERKFYETALTLFKRDVLHMSLSTKTPPLRELKGLNGEGLGLYFAVDEHGLFPHDEIKYVYRVVADSLEAFARQVAKYLADPMRTKPYSQFRDAFDKFDIEFPAIPGNRQNKNRIHELLKIVVPHFEKLNSESKNVLESKELIKVLEALLREMDLEAEKSAEIAITAKYVELKSKMLNQKDKSRSRLSVLDPENIFDEEERKQEIFNHPEKVIAHSMAVINRLLDDSDLCGCRLEENGLYYIGYFNLLQKIKADTKKIKDQNQIKAVEIIDQASPETHPGRDSKKELKSVSSNLYFQAILDLKEAEQEASREKARREQKSLLERIFINLERILNWLFGANNTQNNYNRQNQDTTSTQRESQAEIQAQTQALKEQAQKEAEYEAKYRFAQVSMAMLYPAKFNSVDDKIYDGRKLVSSIKKKLSQIKSQIPEIKEEKDQDKIINNVKRVIMLNSTIMAIPDSLIPPSNRILKEDEPEKYPNTLIFNRKDFKSPLFRAELSEKYRKLAEENRLNEKAKNYYLFIIQEIEMNYMKYFKSRGSR